MTLLGVGVITLEAEVGDVVIHGEATGAMDVVLFEIDAIIQVSFPVFSDVIVLFEGTPKVMGMAVAGIFNTKVVEYKDEENRVPFLAPKTGSGGALVVSVLG